jgi:hypothetical protein
MPNTAEILIPLQKPQLLAVVRGQSVRIKGTLMGVGLKLKRKGANAMSV